MSIEKEKYMTPAHSLKTTRSHNAQYCRHQTYSDALKNSFFPQTIPYWNSLSPSVASITPTGGVRRQAEHYETTTTMPEVTNPVTVLDIKTAVQESCNIKCQKRWEAGATGRQLFDSQPSVNEQTVPVQQRIVSELRTGYCRLNEYGSFLAKLQQVSMSFSLKKFETADEVEEKKRKRQEEWEKVRQPDEPLECPEAPVDNRCLYDKLEEQRQKKQDEYDEQFALKNQVKGLDEDESKFLEFVENRQQEISKERNKEEKQILAEMKNAQVVKVIEVKAEDKKIKSSSSTQSNKKSQSALLAGAVKRKGSEESSSPAKKSKSEGEPSSSSKQENSSANTEANSTREAEGNAVENSSSTTPQVATVIGILPSVLPGLNHYSDTSDSESSSSADSDCDFSLAGHQNLALAVKQIKEQIQQQQGH